MRRIPIIILTGYLGAGKTTLLNHLLGMFSIRDKKIALIINEFGDMSVDGALIRPGSYAKFELNRGSLFCICIKEDFLKTLETIASDVQTEGVLVEATGVAETRDLIGCVDAPHLAENFEVSANLCIVDALNFTKVAPMLKSAVSQVAWADALVINKSDLVNAHALEQLQRVLRSINPGAPIATVSYGKITDEFLGSVKHTVRGGEMLTCPPQAIFSATFRTESIVRRDVFMDALCAMREHILRVKGYIDFGGGALFFEVVGGDVSERRDVTPTQSGSAFVVIAWNIRQSTLEDTIRKAWQE